MKKKKNLTKIMFYSRKQLSKKEKERKSFPVEKENF